MVRARARVCAASWSPRCSSLPHARPAGAQTTTASIRGTVSDETGAVPGATVTARETQSGFQFESVTGNDGSFNLAGLRPGTYDITVTMSQYKPAARTVQVLVGHTVDADFRITPELVYVENVTVVGELLVDTSRRRSRPT